MLHGLKFLISIFTIYISVGVQGCQDTCNCTKLLKVRSQTVSAECSEEPVGEWARNLKFLKIRTSIHHLHSTTLQDAWNLKEADFKFCNITEIQHSALSNTTNLKILWLSHNLIETIDPEAFSKLGRLKQLYLDNNKLVIFNVNIHLSLKYLEELFLQQNKVTEITQLPLNLKILDVSHNNITHFNTLLHEHLTYFDICMNPLEELTNNIIHESTISLCLSGRIVNNIIISFPSLQNFTFISFPNTSTLNKQMQDQILALHHVTSLHLGNTNIHDLLFLLNMTKLETLQLNQVKVADLDGMEEVLSNLHQLKNLDFESSPQIVSAIMKKFQILININSLENLVLRNSNIVHLPCELSYLQRPVKLDFQDNPLNCDCRVAEIESSLATLWQNYIVSPNFTMCKLPQKEIRESIYKYINHANCTGSNMCKNSTNKGFQNFDKLHTSQHEEHFTHYIILSVAIAIVGTIVIGLAVIYFHLRKKRLIEPQQEMQNQTFQELQREASEDHLLRE